MLDSSSERELNAVHSEHSKNLQSDMWRKYQLSKYLAKPGHPYNKFSTGDRSSLNNPNLREMLFNFYNSHYSANLMKLVIYGQSDVDALAKEVETRFEQVINKKYSRFHLKEHPYDQKTIGKLLKYVPVKDNRTLELSWVLKDQSQSYKYSPSKYLSYVLGHEGKGSLLSFLISEDLATGLSAGGTDSYDCFSEFEISVSLTEKGLKSIR
jgi:insulysin